MPGRPLAHSRIRATRLNYILITFKEYTSGDVRGLNLPYAFPMGLMYSLKVIRGEIIPIFVTPFTLVQKPLRGL